MSLFDTIMGGLFSGGSQSGGGNSDNSGFSLDRTLATSPDPGSTPGAAGQDADQGDDDSGSDGGGASSYSGPPLTSPGVGIPSSGNGDNGGISDKLVQNILTNVFGGRAPTPYTNMPNNPSNASQARRIGNVLGVNLGQYGGN